MLRDGHYNGRVSAAVTTVAPTISLLTWVKCPASMLRDGHYNSRVSAAVTTVSPMQFCLHVVGLGRSTSWASIKRARQSAPASRAEGELHQQGCPKDASQRTRAKGREPKVASQRTRAEGREPKDASQRTRAKGREPKDASHRTRAKGRARHCGQQLKGHVRACLLLVPKVNSTNKAEQGVAL